MNYKLLVQDYYSTNPEHFHTLNHAEQVTNNALQIIKKVGLQDLQEAIILSGRFHDAGYHHNSDYAKSFPSKEDYSINILEKVGIENNISNENIQLAIDGIEGTKIYQNNFSSLMRKIMRAADISNLGANYKSMLTDALKIYHEYNSLNKELLLEKNLYPLSREVFQKKQCEILSEILSCSQLHIPEEYFIYKDFYKKMGNNIILLSKQENPL